MAEFPCLPLWTDAYLGDTEHLTLEEHGAYMKLLMIAWRSPNCDLPDDDKRLAIMLRTGARRWGALKPAVMAFWTLTGGRWSQKRLCAEREKAKRRCDLASDAGKASARAKILKNNKSAPTDVPTDVPTERPTERPTEGQRKSDSPYPYLKKKKEEVVLRDQSPSSTLVAEATDGFTEWYEFYPRKKARLAAERAYKTALKRTSREVLLEGLKRYVVQCAGKEQQYIAHPATWLNQGRWEDEHHQPMSGGGEEVAAESAYQERLSWLVDGCYGFDGRWIRNTSGNGVWKDTHGVGPPPHELGTLVTDADLEKFPKAKAMRDKRKSLNGECPPL